MSRHLFPVAALLLLTACAPQRLPDGWYTTAGPGRDAAVGNPIVTCRDFAALQLDSLPSDDGSFVYIITGTLRPEKHDAWADATEAAVGTCLVFLHEGRTIAAPCVNMRNERGSFSISSPEISGNADRMREIFHSLEAQMR